MADNLYMYGPTRGRAMGEHPTAPPTARRRSPRCGDLLARAARPSAGGHREASILPSGARPALGKASFRRVAPV